MSGGIFHCPFKDGDPKALKEYAKAMFSGENIEWKEEGEIPEYSDDLSSGVGRSVALEPRVHAEHSIRTIGGSQPGFDKASFPNFGRQGMPLQRVSCDLHEAHEEFQPGFTEVRKNEDEFRRSLLALP